MADIAQILAQVANGTLTPEEADRMLGQSQTTGRQLRIEISEHGKRLVNLRVPVSVADFAAGFVPGLSDDQAEYIRSSIREGLHGPILDINTDDGDRVLIVNE